MIDIAETYSFVYFNFISKRKALQYSNKNLKFVVQNSNCKDICFGLLIVLGFFLVHLNYSPEELRFWNPAATLLIKTLLFSLDMWSIFYNIKLSSLCIELNPAECAG